MTYRLPDLEISPTDPFLNDALNRKPVVEFLASFLGRVNGPFVMALDSPWGTGKTTLIRMLKAKLEHENFQCVYFNAWQVDYVTDPLVALVSSVDAIQLGIAEAESVFRARLSNVKKITSVVAKRGAVAIAKAVTLGGLDLEKDIEAVTAELAGGFAGDAVDAFQKEKDALNKFRLELELAVAQLEKANKKPSLIICIDELDRCRPTFAIEMLERIKHLFDVPGIIFVLSIDKAQLESSTAAVYGERINAPEYLRRFIDVEYALPTLPGKEFTKVLFKRFKLDEVFAKRSHAELRYDKDHFIDFFSLVADVAQLSLRTRERCMTRLQAVMDQTGENDYLFPPLVALLIVVRAVTPDLFRRLQNGTATAADVIAYFNNQPGGSSIALSRSGVIIEIGLLVADDNQDRKEKLLKNLRETAEADKLNNTHSRASELVDAIKYFQNFYSDGPRLGSILNKIDLSSGLRN